MSPPYPHRLTQEVDTMQHDGQLAPPEVPGGALHVFSNGLPLLRCTYKAAGRTTTGLKMWVRCLASLLVATGMVWAGAASCQRKIWVSSFSPLCPPLVITVTSLLPLRVCPTARQGGKNDSSWEFFVFINLLRKE